MGREEDYKLIRFTVDSEIGETVSCYLTVPKLGKEKYPIAIVLQGHDGGINCSIGEPKNEKEQQYVDMGGDFAVQAVKNGYIGLAVELRGIGEKQPVSENRSSDVTCRWATRTAFFLHRTIVAERIVDIMKAIDALSNFPECDTDKILITGNSGGGTISYYAACLDERIKLSVPSCGLCNYKDSIKAMAHCGCNYIPNTFKCFEMSDLACLIAPRNLIYVTGGKDPIFPVDGATITFERIKEIYRENGAEDKCQLIVTPMAHWWCVDIVWEAINKECEKLGWK